MGEMGTRKDGDTVRRVERGGEGSGSHRKITKIAVRAAGAKRNFATFRVIGQSHSECQGRGKRERRLKDTALQEMKHQMRISFINGITIEVLGIEIRFQMELGSRRFDSMSLWSEECVVNSD